MLMTERHAFFEMIDTAGAMIGKTLTPSIKEAYWDTLCDYSLNDVKIALRKHRLDEKRGRFMPQPTDIVAHLPKRKASQQKPDHGCSVPGCMELGTVSEAGSPWLCSGHYRNQNGPTNNQEQPKYRRPSDQLFEDEFAQQLALWKILSPEEKEEDQRETVIKLRSFGSRMCKVDRSA